ncbi:MAG: hypothetical protein ACI9OJ_002518 [Myxococcota bacterium]|jgi:hypothetical protein
MVSGEGCVPQLEMMATGPDGCVGVIIMEDLPVRRVTTVAGASLLGAGAACRT